MMPNTAARREVVALAYPQHLIEAGEVKADGLISITGVGEPVAAVDPALFGGRILRLSFDDIPIENFTDRHGKAWFGPKEADLGAAMGFARSLSVSGEGPLKIAVHCLHGRSRSVAVAAAVNADSLGAGREDEAVAILLSRGVPGAVPDEYTLSQMAGNPGLIRMADRHLARDGAIEAAFEKAVPRFVTWRAYWRRNGSID